MKIIVIVSLLLLVILIILIIPNVNIKKKSGLVVNPTYNGNIGKMDYGDNIKWNDPYSTYLDKLRPKFSYKSSDGGNRCVKNVSTDYKDFDLSLWNLKDNPPNINDSNLRSCENSIDSRYGIIPVNIIMVGKVPTTELQTLRLDTINFFNNSNPTVLIPIKNIIIYPKSNNNNVLNNGVMARIITASHLEPKIMFTLGKSVDNLVLIDFSAGVNISNYYFKMYRGWEDGTDFPAYNSSIPTFEKIYPNNSTLTGDRIYTEEVNVSDVSSKDITLRFDTPSCVSSGCIDSSNNLHPRQYYIDEHGRCFKPYVTVDHSVFTSDIASTIELTSAWNTRYLHCPAEIGTWELEPYEPPDNVEWVLSADNNSGIDVVDQVDYVVKTWEAVDPNSAIIFTASSNYTEVTEPMFSGIDSNGNDYIRQNGGGSYFAATVPSMWTKTIYIVFRHNNNARLSWNNILTFNDPSERGWVDTDGGFSINPILFSLTSVIPNLFTRTSKDVSTSYTGRDATTSDIAVLNKINIMTLYISLDVLDMYLNDVRVTGFPQTGLGRTSSSTLCSGIGSAKLTIFSGSSPSYDLYEIRSYNAYHSVSEVSTINTEIRDKLGTTVVPN